MSRWYIWVFILLGLTILAVPTFNLLNQKRTLGFGYSRQIVDGEKTIVFDKFSEIVVGPDITRISVQRNFVFGHREKSSLNPRPDPAVGYFILDMRTGKSYQGLQWSSFRKMGSTYGISSSGLETVK